MTYKTLQTNFERELLFQIITLLRNKKITNVRSKQIAQVFLPMLSLSSADEFIEKLAKMSYNYPEIMEAFIIAVRMYEKENVSEGLAQVRNEIQISNQPLRQVAVMARQEGGEI